MSGRLEKLKDRWFPSQEAMEEQSREDEQQEAISRGKVLGFITHEYAGEFKSWLKRERRKADPNPGDPTAMVYQSGVRDGIRLVEDRFDDLEHSCRDRET